MAFCGFSEGAAMFDVTPIENMFLLEYLPGAPGDALRVYLYARMLCLHPELGGEIADIAKALSMDGDDVQEAFAYWERNGLVEKRSDRPPTYAIRMLHAESFHAQKVSEANRYMELRKMVDKLFEEQGYVHEKQFMRLIEWIEDLHYTEKAALRILEFELKQPGGKKPPSVFKRADKRAIEWAERGIHSLEDVENAIRYAGKVSELASVAATQLSLYRAPTVNELECARRWVDELCVTEQDVLDACAETIKSRSPSFAYLDTILRKRKKGDFDAAFEQVKNLIDELGIIGTKPTPERIRQYQGWLSEGFEPETILLAAVQCAQKGLNTFEKLNWMLENWGKAGVRTHAQAQSYLADRQKVKAEAAEVLRHAGRSSEPGQVTLDMYERWKARFSMELILFAAECARGKGRPLSYMDKLLAGWEKSGATTLEAAQAQHAQLASAAGEAARSQSGAPRSMNYQQHSYTEADFDKNFFNDPTEDYPISDGEQEGVAK